MNTLKGRIVVPLIAALALSMTAVAAPVAGESPNNPKADVQRLNMACGADLSTLPVIGFANYHRSGDTVTVQFHLKDALPNTTYYIQLWGDACTFFGPVVPSQSYTVGVETRTNKRGVANVNMSVTVPSGSTRFFATAFNLSAGWSDTPAVTLAP